jgi:hypothetical protein
MKRIYAVLKSAAVPYSIVAGIIICWTFLIPMVHRYQVELEEEIRVRQDEIMRVNIDRLPKTDLFQITMFSPTGNTVYRTTVERKDLILLSKEIESAVK